MNIQTHTLNGLQIVTVDIKDSASTTIQVLVKAWSVMEDAKSNGLSHFLEHMFFKWWKHYPTPKSVAQALDMLGADYNAFTGDEFAWYYIKVAPVFVQKAVDILSDMLVHTQFPLAELEREKWVIIQEIMMYEDMPNRLVGDKRKHWYYWDTAFGRPILGSIENVQSFTQQDFFEHKKNLYTKDNLVIVVAWAIADKQILLDQIATQFSALPEKTPVHHPQFIQKLPKQHENFLQRNTQQHHLIIGCPWVNMFDEHRYAYRMLSTILWWTMSSRLFQNIREQQGLCYYIWATHTTSQVDWTTMIYAGMEKERRKDGLQSIYDELENIKKHWITNEEFEQARSNIQWSTTMGLETSDDIAWFVWRQMLLRWEIISLESILANYMSVTKQEINSAAESLQREKMYAYWIQ